jgi:stage III sporulation protein AB
MLRFAGGLLIIFSASSLGFLKAFQYRERPKEIRQIINFLRKLETEIAFTATPLPEGLSKIAGKTIGKIGSIFDDIGLILKKDKTRTVEEVFSDVFHRRLSETALQKDDRDILLNLSQVLGSTDRDSQIRYIKNTVEQLIHQEEWAIIQRDKHEKTWKNIGVLGGILIVLLLY